jgi:deoxyribose-phosphate aldolase
MKTIKNFNQFVNENLKTGDNIFNSIIDYTSLTEKETEEDIIELCNKAKLLGTKSVCVYPKWVKTASECLSDSDVLVCTVVSFPKGEDTTAYKLAETKKAISDGVDEVDMVLNWKALKKVEDENSRNPNYEEFINDVQTLVEECHKNTNKNGEPVILKVIVESGELTLEETEVATIICLEAGADFIKTSTGKISGSGAELEKIKVMYDTIQDSGLEMKIKASGGVRTLEDIKKLAPYTDRFGMGYASVDQINGLDAEVDSTY